VQQAHDSKEIPIMTTDKARDLAEQIESSVNALATETDEVRKSDLFKQWLNAMATFSSYSWLC
jgi:hypothetical protein